MAKDRSLKDQLAAWSKGKKDKLPENAKKAAAQRVAAEKAAAQKAREARRPPVSADDAALFLSAVDGVTATHAPAKAAVKPEDAASDMFMRAMQGEVPRARDVAVKAEREHVSRAREKVRDAVGRGDIDVDAVLDLHAKRADDARDALEAFIDKWAHRGGMVLLVVHGKGSGVVRDVVLDALDRHPDVAEHVAAPLRLGHHGARLVHLRTAL